MPNTPSDTSPPPSTSQLLPKHLSITAPSPWVKRFCHLVSSGAQVLDMAAGGGRHGRLFLENGANVVFIDRNVTALDDLRDHRGATVIEADLESEASPFISTGPLAGESFDAVVVVNYLHRSLLDDIIAALRPGGVLIYETFARGNEVFARPRNPDHLLKSGELLAAVSEKLQVIAYEHGRIDAADIPGVKQRLCAIKDLQNPAREDGDPPAHSLEAET